MSLQFGSATLVTGQQLSGNMSVTPSFPCTISIWFYSNRIGGREPLISFQCVDNDAEDYFALELNLLSNATVTSRRVETGTYNAATGVKRAQAGVGVGWANNTWVHVAGVFTEASRTAYMNGGNTATETTALVNPSAPVDSSAFVNSTITSSVTNGHDAAGQIVRLAEAGIWNGALTSDEIVSLSKGVKPNNVRPESLIFYSPLIRATGTAQQELTGTSSSISGTGTLVATNFATNYTPTTADHFRRYG